MAEALLRPWTIDEFFAWQERQTERYELVDGLPLKMMAGARNVHDDIVVNLIAALHEKLRGGPCRPFTGDGAVLTRPGQIRRPDVGVDCGRRQPNSMLAAEPKLLIEVLSPTTRDFDSFRKLDEYKGMAGLVHVLLVDPNEPLAALWSKAEGEWSERRVDGLDTTIDLPALGVALNMSEIYDGVEFPIGPEIET
ncbi:MAG: Uma2 family endonuclease [Roseiarcus sp.]